MIYNLVQYLKNEFPAELIYTNIRQQLATQNEIPDRNLLVKNTGGTEKNVYFYGVHTCQIIARDLSAPSAEYLCTQVYNKLHSRFGLILPAITIGAILYPAVQAAQISGIQLPSSMGVDEEGRTEVVCNLKINMVRD